VNASRSFATSAPKGYFRGALFIAGFVALDMPADFAGVADFLVPLEERTMLDAYAMRIAPVQACVNGVAHGFSPFVSTGRGKSIGFPQFGQYLYPLSSGAPMSIDHSWPQDVDQLSSSPSSI